MTSRRGCEVLGSSLVLVICAACGPRPAAGPPASTAPRVQVTPTAPLPEAPPDLSPVPVPPRLRALTRIRSPSRDLATIAQLIPSNNNVIEALRLGPEPLLGNLIGRSLVAEVDLAAPLDMASGGADEMVLSLPLVNLDAARQRATDFRFRALGAGRLSADFVGKGAGAPILRCEVWPTAKGPPLRLICGSSIDSVAALGPFLTRTAVLEPSTSAVRIVMPGAALKAAAEKDAGSAKSPAEAAGEEVSKDVLSQLESIAVDLDLRDPGVEVSLEARVTGAISLGAVALRGRPERSGPLPQAYWKLPKETDLAIYSQGVPPGAYDASAPRTLQAMWAEAYSIDGQLTKAAMTERVQAAQRLFLTGGSVLYAHGHDRSAALAALSGERARVLADYSKARAPLHGWNAVLFEEPVERWREGVRKMIELLESLPPVERSESSAVAGVGPKKKVNRGLETYKLRAAPAKLHLPKGSFHLHILRKPNPAYVPGAGDEPALLAAENTHFLFVPDGSFTWVFLAEDEATAQRVAGKVLAGKPEAQLASRDDLARLRTQKGQLLGYVSLAGILSLGLDSETPDQIWTSRGTLERLSQLPDHGESVVLLHATATPTTKGGGGTRFSAQISPAALGALFSWSLSQESGKP